MPAIPTPDIRAPMTLDGMKAANPYTLPWSTPHVKPMSTRTNTVSAKRPVMSATSVRMNGRAQSMMIYVRIMRLTLV